MSEVLSVYLAGPVQHVADGGASWRASLESDRPEVNWLNPLAKYNIPASDVEIVGEGSDAAGEDGTVTPDEIVSGDKDLLRDADAVLVGYTHMKQIGTPMEVMWAWDHYMPVALWIRDGTDVDELSPWYRYHASKIVHSRSDAVDVLTEATEDEMPP